MNNELKNYYEILGITYDATLKSIETARERELKENWANPIGRLEVEEAFSILSNPEKRSQYDTQLKQYLTEKQYAMGNAHAYADLQKTLNGVSTEVEIEGKEKEEKGTENLKVEEPKVEEPKVEEPKVEEPKVEEPKEIQETEINVGIPIERIMTDKYQKELPKNIKLPGDGSFARWTIIAATTIAVGFAVGGVIAGPLMAGFVGLPIGVLIGDFVKKHYKNITLCKEPKKGKISEIKTEEAKFHEEYCKKLEDKIYDLLSKPGKNYELQIALLKYENQLDLLRKRIELKRSTILKKGVSILEKMSIKSLEIQYGQTEKKLKLLNELLENYEKSSRRDNKLSALNNDIIELNEKNNIYNKLEEKAKLEEINLPLSVISKINKSQIKFTSKLAKRDNLANKMVLNKDGISRRLLTVAYFNKIKEKFNSEESYGIEQNGRTR